MQFQELQLQANVTRAFDLGEVIMNLLEKIEAGETLIFDGAMGTMLIAKGLGTGECPEEWNVSHPDVVCSIHKAYFDVGCDIVETNSFGGSRPKLARFGLADRTQELNRRAAENARAAAGDGNYVAGSVGPTGEFLEPYGTMKYEELLDIFKEQVVALEQGGADIICVETMTDLNEARAAIEATKTSTKCIIFASMTFSPDKRGYRTMMGVDPTTAARTLEEYGADVIGSNCGAGPEDMENILREMSEATVKHLLAKPNAGLPQLVGTETVYPETPEGMSQKMQSLLDVGARIIGGCCGTTPEHLREIARMAKHERS